MCALKKAGAWEGTTQLAGLGREGEPGPAEDQKIQTGADCTALRGALGMPRGSGQKLQPNQMITGDPRSTALFWPLWTPPPPKQLKMCITLGRALLRLHVQSALKQSKHQKYWPQRGVFKGKTWPLLPWSDTEKALTAIFSLAATSWEDSRE